jgi:3-methyladenine DNA glycosylase/8-oxoguanine DNA glycosylase
MTPDASATWPRPAVYDFFATTALLRTGPFDPTLRREPDGLWRTTQTPDGPATVRVWVGDPLRAEAWGPGASRALADIPRWLGLDEPAWSLPPHPVVDRLSRAHRGLRLTDTRDVFEALLTFILQQRITWEEATALWRRLCEQLGAPAPGPMALRLSPTARTLRAVGPERLGDLGIAWQQARTIMAVARASRLVERAADLPTTEADAVLQSVPGVGPWTAAMVLGVRLGRPEPVPVGDVHLPSTVAFALTGEPRADDARMLSLLTPFAPQAFRVVRLVFAAGIRAPRRGPRAPIAQRR